MSCNKFIIVENYTDKTRYLWAFSQILNINMKPSHIFLALFSAAIANAVSPLALLNNLTMSDQMVQAVLPEKRDPVGNELEGEHRSPKRQTGDHAHNFAAAEHAREEHYAAIKHAKRQTWTDPKGEEGGGLDGGCKHANC